MSLRFTAPLVLYFAGLAIRLSYERSKKRGGARSQSKVLYVLVFISMCVLWASWFAMCPKDPVTLELPDMLSWLGLGVFMVGLVLAFGALIQLRGVENINHLVTKGLFARLRHPMYIGFICWIIGWALYHRAGISSVAGLVGIANILYWRHLEENDLALKYGDAYLVYRKTSWL